MNTLCLMILAAFRNWRPAIVSEIYHVSRMVMPINYSINIHKKQRNMKL